MPFCSECGAFSEKSQLRCPMCGGDMQVSDPNAADAPGPPAGRPNSPVAAAPQYGSGSQWAAPPSAGLQSPYPPPGLYGQDYNTEQEEFLSGFSWAPGCGFYFWSRAMSNFLIMGMLLNAVGRLLDAMTGENPEGGAAVMAMLFTLVLFAADIGLMVWAGKVSRRRRWEMLTWTDFEQFRRNELSYNTAGIVGWVIYGLIVVLILGMLAIAPFLPGPPVSP